jgi:acyl carrier protein
MAGMQTAAAQLEYIKAKLHEQIKFNFLFDGQDRDVTDDQSLTGTGIVDPTGVVELAMYLEEDFDITIADEDLTPENFDTVNSIAQYVVGRLANS